MLCLSFACSILMGNMYAFVGNFCNFFGFSFYVSSKEVKVCILCTLINYNSLNDDYKQKDKNKIIYAIFFINEEINRI